MTQRHTDPRRTVMSTACTTLRALAGAALGIALVACASDHKEPLQAATSLAPYEPAPIYTAGSRPISQPLGPELRPVPGSQHAELVGHTRLAAAPADAPANGITSPLPGELIEVRYAANGANILDVARIILDEYLNADFIIDPEIKSNSGVTLNIEGEYTRDELRGIVANLASLAQAHLEERGGVLYVRASKDTEKQPNLARAAHAPILTAPQELGSPLPAMRVVTVSHTDPKTINTLFKELLSPGGTIVVQGRVLIIVDTAVNAERIAQLVELIDVADFEGTEVATFRLAHRTPDDAAKVIDTITTGAKVKESLAFVPVPGTQRLVAIGRDASLIAFAKDLIDQVDVEEDSTARHRYLYRVQHWETTALVDFISGAFSDRMVQSAGAAAPRPQAAASASARTPIGIVGDEAENVLLITATPGDYADVLSTLRAIDRPRQQVHIQSIIAEVNLSDGLDYGVEAFLNWLDEDGIGIGDAVLNAPVAGTGASAGTISFIGADGFVIIQAIQTRANVNILSQPSVTIADGALAEFQVGGDTPVVTGQATGANEDDTTRQDIERIETGVILKVTPHINESGTVTLDIDQEVKEVGNQTEFGPEFTTRRIVTKVTVPHGRTVILGGIIDDTTRRATNRVPGLGDLPLIGGAFGNTSNLHERIELFLTITPTIVNEPIELVDTTSEFLRRTDAIRRLLHESRDVMPQGSLATVADEPLIIRPDAAEPISPEPRPEDAELAPPPADAPAGPPDLPPIIEELLKSTNRERQG